ncbi:hypothetical protein K501DRAFT_316166 [Backusella circina FSU 941]|nr:hypothetical protein K501DRAFT_316166 [Backusella circina FSU 941]
MKRLPLEVLREIFLFLHQNDKLECMLVCRQWKEILEHSALYHTFCIFSQASLKWLTEKIQGRPDIANKIMQLVICSDYVKVNLSTLLPLLPSIKSLFCSSADFNNLIINKTVQQYPWSKCIKRIDDLAIHSVTYHLLSSNTCPNLTTLNITDYSQNIIPLLKNAPALMKLSLGCGMISLKNLEVIHQNTPYLRSLVVQNVSVDGSEIDDMIEPAILVTECIFTNVNVGIFKMRIDLLVYILKKYPSLSKFMYNVADCGTVVEDIVKLNENGWLPLFQSVGSQLQTFGICDGYFIDNLFKELDKFSCRIEKLKLWTIPSTQLVELAQSQQTLYIQTLVLNDMRYNCFEWLKKLEVLKKLKIDYFRYKLPKSRAIELADILENAPPSLKSLSLHNLILDADPDYVDTSKVEALSFYRVYLPQGVGNYISSHFPNLSTLKLKNCQRPRIIDLSKLNLFSFRFTEHFQRNSNIFVITHSSKETLRYSVKNVSCGMSLTRETKPYCPTLDCYLDPNLLFGIFFNSLMNISFE